MSPEHLTPGAMVDSAQPAVVQFAACFGGVGEPRGQAVALYYAVRDGIAYDPYRIELSPRGFGASGCLERGYGFCVPKAALLAAAARAVGIPSRVGYADVRNHLTSRRLREMMKSDLFLFHGYTELWLEGRWVKATPASDAALCARAGILPLEFDGRADAVFHPFDASGRRHMEYVRDRGSFADVPFETIVAAWREAYPVSASWSAVPQDADFAAEARAPGDHCDEGGA